MAQLSALITGASTGIGKACALRLDKEGWKVFAGVRKPADGDALQSEASDRLVPVQLDITNPTDIAAVRELIAESVGDAGLAGLVNNAGIAVAGPLEFTPIEQLRTQLEINVVGQVAVTQAFIPLLRLAQGRIVNMSSIAGRSSVPFMGPYSASKYALEAISDALRLELKPWGIHTAIIEPGTIETPIWKKSLAAADQLLAQLPAAAEQLYGPALQAIRKIAANPKGIPASAVADVVFHALTADTPKNRYVVGQDAKIRVWLERLPDRLRDRIIMSQLPKYGG
jgi:NAD(P)-dependent dehydrogenase (short-subunit alcohol dehydrogenase family)